MGEGKEENAIVTSTGEYVVAWDFAKVKKGQLDKYEIKKCVCCFILPFASPLPPDSRPPHLRSPSLVRARLIYTGAGTTSWSCKTISSLATIRRSCVFHGYAVHMPMHEAHALSRLSVLQIVALQNDVLAINKKNLKRPTRASLAPSAGRSRSSIVNSPY